MAGSRPGTGMAGCAGAELQPLGVQKSNTEAVLVGKRNNGQGFILTTQGISHNKNAWIVLIQCIGCYIQSLV